MLKWNGTNPDSMSFNKGSDGSGSILCPLPSELSILFISAAQWADAHGSLPISHLWSSSGQDVTPFSYPVSIIPNLHAYQVFLACKYFCGWKTCILSYIYPAYNFLPGTRLSVHFLSCFQLVVRAGASNESEEMVLLPGATFSFWSELCNRETKVHPSRFHVNRIKMGHRWDFYHTGLKI